MICGVLPFLSRWSSSLAACVGDRTPCAGAPPDRRRGAAANAAVPPCDARSADARQRRDRAGFPRSVVPAGKRRRSAGSPASNRPMTVALASVPPTAEHDLAGLIARFRNEAGLAPAVTDAPRRGDHHRDSLRAGSCRRARPHGGLFRRCRGSRPGRNTATPDGQRSTGRPMPGANASRSSSPSTPRRRRSATACTRNWRRRWGR